MKRKQRAAVRPEGSSNNPARRPHVLAQIATAAATGPAEPPLPVGDQQFRKLSSGLFKLSLAGDRWNPGAPLPLPKELLPPLP